MIDEGPSPEDLERFGGGGDQTGYCPKCGAEIWDDLEQCPMCHTWIAGGPRSRSPQEADARRRLITMIVVVTLVGFLAFVGAVRLF